YCYEDFAVGRMAPETVQGVKRLIDRRVDGLSSLSLSWFGGEPLLARAVVEDVSQHVACVITNRPDLQYEGDMTTNGYLLDIETADRLAAFGIRLYQISLDGPEVFHDRTRLRADGRGSFRRIWDNLLAIRNSKILVGVLLRVHLNLDNLPSMPA